ncbi:MAG: arsenite efflux transporter metallochaperone ArsD [Firmicutes bacterium]|nr:arsenite efflux transporter metallochaperone ArsD [Bacillota bacterium]
MTVEIFDPELCCSTGICGAAPDPALIQAAQVVEWLQRRGVSVARYQLSRHPQQFLQNPVVYQKIVTGGVKCLPLVAVNGAIKWSGRYPSYDEVVAEMMLD